ncbi:MAG: sulfate adenylyltransferase subunit 2 [Alphaproteobacteria bacterium]|nr:sulfate adenylyltransferase subunit 2 [Alphaproteobacteria bacterium]
MDALDRLESDSIYILREAYHAIDRLALLWSLGKDSGALLWLARKAFFGRVPFPVAHVDTGRKFPAMYAYRDRFAREWNLDLVVGTCPPLSAIDPTLPPAARSAARKTAGLKTLIAERGYRGLVVGIRRDEEATRAKERIFSPRDDAGGWDTKDQPPEFWDQFNTTLPPGAHLRIHPLLAWTEIDIWRYVRREGIPVVGLYFARNGKRYRSLGDQDITHPVASTAATLDEIIAELEHTKVAERSGRAMDHEAEDAFERLRSDGYL